MDLPKGLTFWSLYVPILPVSGSLQSAIVGARGLAAVLVGAALSLALAPPSAPAADPAAGVSAAFTLRGSNGFAIDVGAEAGAVVLAASERRPPIATFAPDGRPRPAATVNGAASIYYARGAGAGATEVRARLGGLGRIEVSFRPSGRTRVTVLRVGKHGCAEPVRIVRRLGTFTGTIRFQGEDGYTAVEATEAPGSVGTPLPAGCGGGAASASAAWPDPDSAVLSAANRRAGTSFRASTTDTGVSFLAVLKERLPGGVVVSRRAYAGAPPSTFSFDRGLGRARVKPPAPFSGSARFDASARGPARWSGNLRATFPGVNLPMTGPGFRPQLGPAR
jgi:hypothetical protein